MQSNLQKRVKMIPKLPKQNKKERKKCLGNLLATKLFSLFFRRIKLWIFLGKRIISSRIKMFGNTIFHGQHQTVNLFFLALFSSPFLSLFRSTDNTKPKHRLIHSRFFILLQLQSYKNVQKSFFLSTFSFVFQPPSRDKMTTFALRNSHTCEEDTFTISSCFVY